MDREFVPQGQKINAMFYLSVMKRLLSPIRCMRSQNRKKGGVYYVIISSLIGLCLSTIFFYQKRHFNN